MIVFKTYLKVLNKCKGPVILYTVILLFFAYFSLQTNETGGGFAAAKPKIFIINEDVDEGITAHLTNYLKDNCNLVSLDHHKEAIDDAIFYRDVSMAITIPEQFNENFMQGKKPQLEIRTTQDYNAALAKIMLERYLSNASFYQQFGYHEEALLKRIDTTMTQKSEVEMTSSLDNEGLSKAAYYFNFTNYSIIAGCIFVICIILAIFKNEMIAKRTLISSFSYRKLNRQLLLSNCLFAFGLWLLYIVIGIVLVKDVMLTMHGVMLMLNALVFTICAVTMAFLIANVVTNKNAINGIVNVVALGSCFLCGAFVPAEMLPDLVLKIAHVLPSYWFINANNLIAGTEQLNAETLQPIFFNMGVVLCFSLLFVIITNFISKRKRKFA